MSQSPSTQQHRAQAAQSVGVIRVAILTISDTRTRDTDTGGQLIHRLIREASHHVADTAIVRDDAPAIHQQLTHWLTGDAHVILTTGGTGIASRDTTIEVVSRLLTQTLDGFGELFRMLSYEQVGPAAMLSRALAGLAGDKLIFTMPGSTAAVELAMTRLILPELAHLVWERRR